MTAEALARWSAVTSDPTLADAMVCACRSRSFRSPIVESTSLNESFACLMLSAYADRCSSVLRSCCAMADAPGSTLGALSRLPDESSFCTSSNCCWLREIDPIATLVRNRLLTRASWRGKIAIQFWIVDFGLRVRNSIQNPQSNIQNH